MKIRLTLCPLYVGKIQYGSVEIGSGEKMRMEGVSVPTAIVTEVLVGWIRALCKGHGYGYEWDSYEIRCEIET